MKTSTIASLSFSFLLSMPLATPVRAGTRAASARPGARRPLPRPPRRTPGPARTTGSSPATSCGSRSTRTPSCRSRCRCGRTGRSRCRSSATSPAEGRTATELRDTLVTSLKEYNTNPVVTVIVVETVPPVFYVMGEVNNPGTLPLKGQITVVQALAMAGGFKDFAKTKDIVIQRKGPAGITSAAVQLQRRRQGQGTDDLPAARRHDHRSVTACATQGKGRHENGIRHHIRVRRGAAAGDSRSRRSRSRTRALRFPSRTPGWSLTPGFTFGSDVRLERRAGVGAGGHADDAGGSAARSLEPFGQLEFFSPAHGVLERLSGLHAPVRGRRRRSTASISAATSRCAGWPRAG